MCSADLHAEPAELVARNRWKVIAQLVTDALIADRSAAEGGLPVDGVLTVVSNQRKGDLVLPGLVIAPRTGLGPLDDDLEWAEGLRLTSDARTFVDNLAIARGRGGRLARKGRRSARAWWQTEGRVGREHLRTMASELDVLLDKVEDLALRTDLKRQVELLRAKRRFGLVFEEHLPERVQLPEHTIRRGTRVVRRDSDDEEPLEVVNVAKKKVTVIRDYQNRLEALGEDARDAALAVPPTQFVGVDRMDRVRSLSDWSFRANSRRGVRFSLGHSSCL